MGREANALLRVQPKVLAAFVAAFLLAVQMMAVVIAHQASALTTVKVDSLTDDGWSTADTRSNGHVNLIEDATAPLGNGALSLKTDSNPTASQDKAQFMMATNVPLSTVVNNPLYYSTKQNSASFVAGLPSYQIAVNLLGTSGFTTLVYEPYNNEGNDAVHNGEWQQWNVGGGKFWSTRAVGSLQPSQGQYQYTLAQILSEFPNATIVGVGVNIGSNNPGYDTETDNFAFNGSVYDFDPAPVAPAIPTGLGFTQPEAMCDGATKLTAVNFKWNSVASTMSYTYHIDRPGLAPVEATIAATSTPSVNLYYEGQYSFKVRANGINGLQSDWSSVCQFKVDRTAPFVTITGPNFVTPLGSTVTVTGTTSTDSTQVTVQLNGTTIGQTTPAVNGNWSLTVSTPPFVHAGNAYTVTAIAQDAAGNTGSTFGYVFFSAPFPWF